LVGVILAIGVGLVVWKKRVGGHSESFNHMSRAELELLLSDVAKTNPMVLKRLAEDPEMKKQQLENLKQLLAFASQAQREGLADEPSNREELRNIKAELQAVSYDREINKDKGPMPPFGFISEDQIKTFWEAPPAPGEQGFLDRLGLGEPADTRSNEQKFNDWLSAKIEILRASNPDMANREISEEERTQARESFAKVRIYQAEYQKKAKAGELSEEFIAKTNLQVKLQQAQFLARLYAEKAAERLKVSDEEIEKYIAAHPELSPDTKRAKAEEILQRARSGEDFAALANEFSDDPGNQGADGTKQGGLYKDVPKGRMVAPFEEAALKLEAGEVAPEVVPTDFGFHIIKLERKLGPSPTKKDEKDPTAGESDGETYDVRHILITTMIKDPDNPMAREMPVKEYVRTKLETEREKKMVEDIVASNGVQVPEDFTIPEISDAQLQQQMRQRQQPQMPPPGEPGNIEDDVPEPAKPADKKPAAKKK
jgi:hypothetical protein